MKFALNSNRHLFRVIHIDPRVDCNQYSHIPMRSIGLPVNDGDTPLGSDVCCLCIAEKEYRKPAPEMNCVRGLPQSTCLYVMRLSAILIFILRGTGVLAGPPFVTDDPQPVPLYNWEVYLASHTTHDSSGSAGTFPHIELNYGAAKNLQIHLIMPYAFNRPPDGDSASGYGDTELGVKYRFVQETPRRPMIGIFPLLEVPSGNPSRGLGTGHFQLFLPIWLQKSWGRWTTYGGGGYFINPGVGNRDYGLIGWEIQNTVSEHLTLGGEIFGTTPTVVDGKDEIDFNIGGIYDFNPEHHLLFSAGRAISGDVDFMGYIAFQWTFGPKSADVSAFANNLSLLESLHR